LLKALRPRGKKVKKGLEIIQIISPPKPSKSPWVSQSERMYLQEHFKEDWEFPEMLRKQWVELEAPQQHANFNTFVNAIKAHYQKMAAISGSVNAKLGHRKKWIEDACREAGVAPKTKKEKGNMFLWTQAFFKLNLKKLGYNQETIRVFAPPHYLNGDEWKQDWDEICKLQIRITNSTDLPKEIPEARLKLWSSWANRFAPKITDEAETVEGEPLDYSSANPFAHLERTSQEGSENGDES